MCIVLIAKNTIKDFPLIILANRDEYFERETKSLGLWKKNKEILAGKDLRAGGTWLGVTRSGRVAALTNLPTFEKTSKNKKSRGLLIKDFLTDNINPYQYVEFLEKTKNQFLGFNLVVGIKDILFHYSNATSKISVLNDGIHVMTNSTFDNPWPKGNILKKRVKDVITEKPSDLIESFFSILGPSSKVHLLNKAYKESIFITGKLYGTRSSSVLMFHKNGSFNFNERSYSSRQKVLSEKKFYLKDGKYAEHLETGTNQF
ncbi:MAG: hypothetical protein CBC29_09850 [Methylococcaceae bacterium TMED69]|nr:MAG: hypothetical protein CBC29_09850 [Methylococcaceae bacterium TMED69]